MAYYVAFLWTVYTGDRQQRHCRDIIKTVKTMLQLTTAPHGSPHQMHLHFPFFKTHTYLSFLNYLAPTSSQPHVMMTWWNDEVFVDVIGCNEQISYMRCLNHSPITIYSQPHLQLLMVSIRTTRSRRGHRPLAVPASSAPPCELD